jgi:hypothetical protein
MQVIVGDQNSGATRSTMRTNILVRRRRCAGDSLLYSRAYIKIIFYSNAEVVDYKVISKVPVRL